MAFMYGLKNDAIADDAAIEPHKVLGILGTSGLAGKTYYVSSTHSRAGLTLRHGTRSAPFTTLAYAITNLSAANLAKATFVLLPGHTEAIASSTALDIDVDGITIIAVGVDAYQPTLTFTTTTTATCKVSAANVTIQNVRFECNKTGNDLAVLLTITGAGAVIQNCLFTEGTSTRQADVSISIGAVAHRTVIRNCEIISASSGAESGILIAGTTDRVKLIGNLIFGNFSNAPIYSASVHTKCFVIGNCGVQLGTTVPIRFTAAASGLIANNRFGIATALANRTGATGTDIGSCYACENYVSDSEADTSGLLTPVGNTH